MKKVVAFFLTLIIFVTPVTTFVKADVVIGDNDETIINENATIIGRKIALMESLSDLALSGVTEFTISNTNDIDSYLDSLWSELNDAIDSLSDGTGFTEISDTLKSKYFTNLVQYKDYINNRGDYFSHFISNPSTSLLSTFFADNIFGKHSTLQNNLSLDAFRSLSDYRGNNNPSPDPDFSFINNINQLIDENVNIIGSSNFGAYQNGGWDAFSLKHSSNSVTYIYTNLTDSHNINHVGYVYTSIVYPVMTISLTNNGDNTYTATYTTSTPDSLFPWSTHPNWRFNYLQQYNSIESWGQSFTFTTYTQSTFAGLSTAINYIYQHYANINLYVDNVPWALVSNSSSNPTLDIDGFLKIYGNDYPQQYELQPNTQIDYDQLYQVIYNAIRDNLPISQGDINYYDSHDTIYSPTIINNYGEDEGDESDLIDTILDYAVIPKFDTAIAQPMRNALTNGVVIMNTSITDVIPNDILLIFGACFFLLLFAVVINRMIK